MAKVFCSLPQVPEPEFSSSVHAERAALIRVGRSKWANKTVLHYFFFRSPSRWSGSNARKQTVRDAFAKWKSLGIGLDFQEVDSASEAEIRIGFERNDGHWSYVGRDILSRPVDERTMNLDKGDIDSIDTALHEIGHTLGFPHEHQNPNAGIVWDEEAVYRALAQPPNSWDRSKTFHNIIRKIAPDEVQGSHWDPDSIMHYPFEAGLIVEPTKYATGLDPAPGLSERDIEWIKTFYPPLSPSDHQKLKPFQSVPLTLKPGEEAHFNVQVDASRNYSFRTFGESDTVMVLFEEIDGEQRYVIGDDDSGEDWNASFQTKLFAGRKYTLRLRLYYQNRSGDFSVMMW